MRMLMIVLAACTLAAGLLIGVAEMIAVTDVVDDDEFGD